jgi:hypothetical protein
VILKTGGDGHARALAICGQLVLPQNLQAYQPQAETGSTPPNWNPQVIAYRDSDILRLVIFYNDDFGIVAGDTLATMREKIVSWLVEYL